MGDMELAKHLIQEAQKGGGDLVKFQLYDHNKLYKDHPEIPNVELSFANAELLFNHGREVGVEVFFSVFDTERVKWCEEIGVKRYKIGTLRKDEKVIKAVWDTMKPVIISVFNSAPPLKYNARTSYLYCVPDYPATIKRLSKIQFREYDGFSDHTIGLDCARIALARGAKILEKHFTLDHKTGIDGAWSMTPEELHELKRFETVVREVL